jgi:hypothetical protein
MTRFALIRAALTVVLAVVLWPVGALAAMPTVTVTAEHPSAHEGGPTPGVFLFRRTDVSTRLVVEFRLAGTAAVGSDFLIWEEQAVFETGANTARIAILPRNDAVQEGNETVVLELSAGPDYLVGSPAAATVQVADLFFSGFTGVVDRLEVDPASGVPLVSPDIVALDASIAQDVLTVRVALTSTAGLNNVEIYLDTDQNTGDYRAGHVAGQEYRLYATAGFSSGAELYRLPLSPPVGALEIRDTDEFVTSLAATTTGNWLVVSVPLSLLGGATTADVFAVTHRGANDFVNAVYPGAGDRAPDYGAVDTVSRQVVVRRPGRTSYARITDPSGDATNGFDILAIDVWSIADQVLFALSFSRMFDPTRAMWYPGPRGELWIDGDRNLATGAFPMGATIATWGGDRILFFDMASTMTSSVVVQLATDSAGGTVVFGQGRNDGRWLVRGNVLFLSGSASLYDGSTLVADETSSTVVRSASDGTFFLQGLTLEPAFARAADSLPGNRTVVDTLSGEVRQPFAWTAARVSASDPREYGMVSGFDVTAVDAEIIREHLVVKASLSAWQNTDIEIVYDIYLDLDGDAATAPFGLVANQMAGGPPIGADAVVRIESTGTFVSDAPTFRVGVFRAAPGLQVSRHDALVTTQRTDSLALPGSVTVALPLDLLGLAGPTIRLYMVTGHVDSAGGLDIAANRPLQIEVAPAQ